MPMMSPPMKTLSRSIRKSSNSQCAELRSNVQNVSCSHIGSSFSTVAERSLCSVRRWVSIHHGAHLYHMGIAHHHTDVHVLLRGIETLVQFHQVNGLWFLAVRQDRMPNHLAVSPKMILGILVVEYDLRSDP